MKILLLKNKLSKEESQVVDKALIKTTELLNTIQFPHSWHIFETQTNYTTLPLLTMKGEYQISPNEIYLEEKKFGDYDVVCLVYNPKGIKNPPIRPTENAEFIQMPTTWYNGHIQVLSDFILHELCHERFYALGLPDTTHNFYTSEFTKFADGWTRYYLSLLEKMKLKGEDEVVIKRQKSNKQTLGKIYFKGQVLDTLELPDLYNQRNISCIPKGKYEVKWTFSPRFVKFTYEILNVPNRSGIRIHSANYYYQLNGCIALGNGLKDINKDGIIDIVNSRNAIKQFEDIMGRKPFTLIIS